MLSNGTISCTCIVIGETTFTLIQEPLMPRSATARRRVGSGRAADDGDTAGLPLLLRRVARALEQHVTDALAEHDLSAQQWRVLAALLEEPGQTMTRLAASAVVPASASRR
jgi:hypothetical protein